MATTTEQQRHEAEQMRRVPGIAFIDGTRGRVPVIEGTGIEVFEIVKTLRAVERDPHALTEAYHWLAPGQLHAALDYASAYPDEIAARLAREDAITPEYLRAKHPWPERHPAAG